MKFTIGFIWGVITTLAALTLLSWLGDPVEYKAQPEGGQTDKIATGKDGRETFYPINPNGAYYPTDTINWPKVEITYFASPEVAQSKTTDSGNPLDWM